jgi:hypothetical protein
MEECDSIGANNKLDPYGFAVLSEHGRRHVRALVDGEYAWRPKTNQDTYAQEGLPHNLCSLGREERRSGEPRAPAYNIQAWVVA